MIKYLKLLTLALFMSVTFQVTPSIAQDEITSETLPTLGNQLRVLDNGFQVFAVPGGEPVAVDRATGNYYTYNPDTRTANTDIFLGTNESARIEGYIVPTSTTSNIPVTTNRLRTLSNGFQVYATETGDTIAVDRATGNYYDYDADTRTANTNNLLGNNENAIIDGYTPPSVVQSTLPELTNRLRKLNNGLEVFGKPGDGAIAINPDTGQFYDVDTSTGSYYAIDATTGQISDLPSGSSQFLIANPGSRLDTGNVVVNEQLPELTNRLRTLDNGLEIYGKPGDGAVAINRDTGQFYDVDTTTGEYYAINSITGIVSATPSGSDSALIANPESRLSTGNNNTDLGNILRTTVDGYQIRTSSDGSTIVAVDPETGSYFSYDGDTGEVNLDNVLGTDLNLQIDGFTRLPPEIATLGQLASGSLRGIDVAIDGVDTSFRIIADRNFDDVYYALNTATGEYFSYDTATRTIDFGASFGIDAGFGTPRGSVADGISARPSRVVAPGASRIVAAPARRTATTECGDGDLTLGKVICNTVQSFEGVPGLLSGFAYLCGLILGFMGIMKLKDHVESPNQVPIWDPIKRFIAGGAFFALPMVIEAVYFTIALDGTVLEQTGDNYNTSAVSGGGLDAKIVALVADVWEPMQWALTGFSWIAGLVLILIGISRLLKSEQEGARGPLGIGTIMTFLVAGVLLSLNTTLGAAVESLFQNGTSNYAELAYTQGMSDEAIGHSNAVIGAIMAFVAILGWVSFIRGFFIMRGVAEGNSQASMMAGVTHILGGAVAVNLGGIISAVQTTLGINDLGLTISSIEPYITSVTMMA